MGLTISGASATVPGVIFSGSLFDSALQPGEAAGWNSTAGEWQRWTPSISLSPEGLRGNSNNVIQSDAYVPGGAPYTSGLRFYADEASPGQLTNTINEHFIGRAIEDTTLLVNVGNATNWEAAKTTFEVEHESTSGVHNEGSGRTWVGLVSALNAASGSLASSTGMTYFATDTGQVFHCTDGATNTWLEVSTFAGPLSVSTELTVSGDLRLPSKVLNDTSGDLMDPFAHALRHLVGGSDPLSGIVNQVLSTGDVVTFVIPNPACSRKPA